jgi:rhodanese-related sulfurtransferase
MKMMTAAVAATLILLVSCSALTRAGDGVVMISTADLRRDLSDPGLKIVDARDPRSWERSTEKIPGAVREDPGAVPMWLSKYDKADRIVVYCD